MLLNGTPFTIVGVAPESFRGIEVNEAPDLWVPLMMEGVTHPQFTGLDDGLWRVFKVIGRLRPDVTIEAAQAELTVVSARTERLSGPRSEELRVVVRPDPRRPDPEFTASALAYLMPFVGVVLVLVAACANLMGLLLARLFARRWEFAVQMALGAHHRKIVAGVLIETWFLAVIGSGLGLVLARGISMWIQVHGDLHLDFSLDYRIAAFTVLLGVLAGSVIGLVPGIQATRADLVADLRDQGGVPRRNRAHGVLVSAQIAISLVLVTGAVLSARTLRAIHREDTGFETENLLLAECDLEESGYSNIRAQEFFQTLTDRLNGLPGVLHVARSNEAPLDRGGFSDGTDVVLGEGPGSERHRVQRARVTPGYFETLGVRLLAGRDFTATDDSTGALVAIVNEAMARTLWPDEDPLGQRLSMIFILRRTPVTVVGISPDLRSFSKEGQARPELLVPLAQHPEPRQWVLVRGSRVAGDLASAISDEIRRLDPHIPSPTVETAHQRRVRIRSDERFFADLTGAYAFLGILFSTLGLFGILSLEVSQKSREVGLRMALGAQRRQAIQEVLNRGMRLALPGIAVGLLGALGVSRLLGGLLFGVESWDPVSFGGAALLFLAVTVGVCIVPALRAGTVDPGSLLRSE
jgi:predicted permease